MTVIRIQDRLLTPWKNGLGRTREIAVHPSEANMDDFLWRASIAEVDSAAPFSTFSGIDRQIVLLDGAGFTMVLDDDETHLLTTPFEPYPFAGESAVRITLAGGATRDFNLMTRRGRVRGELEIWRGSPTKPITPDVTLLYCAQGNCVVANAHLATGDAWLTEPDAQSHVTMQADTVVIAIHIEIHAAP